jgi:hypothetical protein
MVWSQGLKDMDGGAKLKIVAFSIFGNSDLYSCGAVENSRLISELLPGWTPFMFVGDSISEPAIGRLADLGAVVVRKEGCSEDLRAVFWRFEAVFEEGVSRVIFRDADSRITPREVALIHEWEKSRKAIHVIRDHPFHSSHILAGMWGVCGKAAIREVGNLLKLHPRSDNYGDDQIFTNGSIYPVFAQRMLIHARFNAFEGFATRLPLDPDNSPGFIGERIACDGSFDAKARQALHAHSTQRWRRVLLTLVHIRQYLAQTRLPLFSE